WVFAWRRSRNTVHCAKEDTDVHQPPGCDALTVAPLPSYPPDLETGCGPGRRGRGGAGDQCCGRPVLGRARPGSAGAAVFEPAPDADLSTDHHHTHRGRDLHLSPTARSDRAEGLCFLP